MKKKKMKKMKKMAFGFVDVVVAVVLAFAPVSISFYLKVETRGFAR